MRQTALRRRHWQGGAERRSGRRTASYSGTTTGPIISRIISSAFFRSSGFAASMRRCNGCSSVDVSPGGLYLPPIRTETLHAALISSCVAFLVSVPLLLQSLMLISICGIALDAAAAMPASGVLAAKPSMPFTRRSASAAASLMAGLAAGAGSGEPPSIDASAGAIDNSAGLIDAGGTTVVVFAPGGVALLFCGSVGPALRFFGSSRPEKAEAARQRQEELGDRIKTPPFRCPW